MSYGGIGSDRAAYQERNDENLLRRRIVINCARGTLHMHPKIERIAPDSRPDFLMAGLQR